MWQRSIPTTTSRSCPISLTATTSPGFSDGTTSRCRRLTLETITSQSAWWAIDETSSSLRVERHPSGPFLATSASGRGFEEAPEDHLDEMLAVLEAEFRRRGNLN